MWPLIWDIDPAVFYQLSKYYDDFKEQPLPVAKVDVEGIGRGRPSCEPLAFEAME